MWCKITKICLVCQHDKVERAKITGLTLDFITHLPKVGEIDSIFFLSSTDFLNTSHPFQYLSYVLLKWQPQIFFKMKLWGIPVNIVNDRDDQFTGTLWIELFKMFGFAFNITSSYHSKTDGQIERFNIMLEE